MLTPDEVRRVDELDRHLVDADPAWAARMGDRSAVRPLPALPLAGGALYVVAPVVALFAGWPAVVALLAAFAVVAAMAVARRRR
jgi:hypothetical protein